MRELTTSELSRLMGYIRVNKEENMCRGKRMCIIRVDKFSNNNRKKNFNILKVETFKVHYNLKVQEDDFVGLV
ncbi:hypothetical protein AHAS_Ahas11G0184800 [Arachis hypogaea]